MVGLDKDEYGEEWVSGTRKKTAPVLFTLSSILTFSTVCQLFNNTSKKLIIMIMALILESGVWHKYLKAFEKLIHSSIVVTVFFIDHRSVYVSFFYKLFVNDVAP